MNKIFLSKNRIYSGSLILVNKEHPFYENSTDSMVPVLEGSPILLKRQATALLSTLMDEIHGWRHIAPVSGWRSFPEQQEIWNDTLKKNGLEFTQKYVALPGHSEHQTGLAIDLGLKQDKIDFICPEFPYTGICQRFRKHSAAHGFIERYPSGKEHITGIGHEPWHFRYVGVPHSEIMSENDLTLEEYIHFIKEYRYSRNPYLIKVGNQEVFVSYIPADHTKDTELEVDPLAPYSISGNNTDGFILTEWRESYAYKRTLWRA